ncbi:hypothetical protein LCI18_002933 [Fusarium solani-melongenae]|uniref:Uncharacterized protein n=1 Tax=Fusarium solani subsp. cucurbitae TaxID=2747967 RepID=A0ACD3YVV1_FUSSC|nr:hypothetical protein LCI18_002933 [Fusarium solani-melongenae]
MGSRSTDMPKLTLYQVNGACSLVPHAIMRHFKIPFNTVRLKFGKYGLEAADGSFNNAQYRSIHPRGYVPALTTDNEIITEMPAVLNYISSLIPEENLFGSDAIEHIKVLEWLAFLSGTLHGLGYGAWLAPRRFSDTGLEEIRAKGKKVIQESYERINNRLKDRGFVIGQAVTAVDFNVYNFARWAEEVNIDLKMDYGFYYEHACRIEKLEGLREAIEAEGLKLLFA